MTTQATVFVEYRDVKVEGDGHITLSADLAGRILAAWLELRDPQDMDGSFNRKTRRWEPTSCVEFKWDGGEMTTPAPSPTPGERA